jgi:uracil-DNA glycosylase family 4
MVASMKEQYLQALGIDRWVLRQPVQKAVENNAATAVLHADRQVPFSKTLDSNNPSTMDWESLAHCVADCTKCNLHGGRTQTVFGVGNRTAHWMIIGEAPGAEEDARGEPFVGRAGQLLNGMLQAIGLQRQQVYIANILKCRPPNNRDPLPEEVQQCWPYLKRQIELIEPKVILAVGRIAAQNLLMTEEAIGRLRGKIHTHVESGIPVVATYHPAYLLRKPADKRKAWEDLQLACRALQQAHS